MKDTIEWYGGISKGLVVIVAREISNVTRDLIKVTSVAIYHANDGGIFFYVETNVELSSEDIDNIEELGFNFERDLIGECGASLYVFEWIGGV